MKVIIANGPPFSGKDTFADYLVKIFPGAIKVRIKDVLYEYSYKHWSINSCGLTYDQWIERCNGTVLKDIPISWLGDDKVKHRSPRQALIHVSEDILKPQYGEAGVAILTADRLKRLYPDWKDKVFIFSDGGFNVEVKALQTEFDIVRRDMYIFRLDKNGCSFNNDSREYIKDFDKHLYNNGSIKDFHDQIRSVFRFIVLTDFTWPIPLIAKGAADA